MKQNVNIVCVCVGKKYGKEWVDRLYKMVEANCTLPFTFYCISDIQQNVNTIFVNEELDLEGYWWKIEVFKLDFKEPTLYLDLDVVIQNNIDYLFDKVNSTLKVIKSSDIGEHYPFDGTSDNILPIPSASINTSMMLFRPFEHKILYHAFLLNIDYNMIHYYGLDRFICHNYENLSYFAFTTDYYHRAKGYLSDDKLDEGGLNFDPTRTICILSQCTDEHYKGLEKYFL